MKHKGCPRSVALNECPLCGQSCRSFKWLNCQVPVVLNPHFASIGSEFWQSGEVNHAKCRTSIWKKILGLWQILCFLVLSGCLRRVVDATQTHSYLFVSKGRASMIAYVCLQPLGFRSVGIAIRIDVPPGSSPAVVLPVSAPVLEIFLVASVLCLLRPWIDNGVVIH